MRILLVGNFGAKNLGDELILLAALQDYPEATVMTADSEWSQNFCERTFKTVVFPPTAFRSWFKYAFNASYRAEVKALKNQFDRIIFVGGGLFAIKTRACVLWWLVFRWLKRLNPKAEVWFEHQGLDKNLSWWCRAMAKAVLAQADFVSVRDEAALAAAQNLKIIGAELKTDRFWEADFGWIPALPSNEIIIINARATISDELAQKIYRQFKGKDLVFVAFELSDLKFVPHDWPGRVEFPTTKSDLFTLVDQAELVIGERLHALLMGSKALGPGKVKLLRAPYAEKVEAFAKTLEWERF